MQTHTHTHAKMSIPTNIQTITYERADTLIYRQSVVWETEMSGLNKQTLSFPCVNHHSNEPAAQLIDDQFDTISQRLPHLDINCLPAPSNPKSVHESEVARRLQSLKVQCSTTPTDLPMKLHKFYPERPSALTISASLQQLKCPADWKTLYVFLTSKSTSP